MSAPRGWLIWHWLSGRWGSPRQGLMDTTITEVALLLFLFLSRVVVALEVSGIVDMGFEESQ